jgi:hypothetical protein
LRGYRPATDFLRQDFSGEYSGHISVLTEMELLATPAHQLIHSARLIPAHKPTIFLIYHSSGFSITFTAASPDMTSKRQC